MNVSTIKVTVTTAGTPVQVSATSLLVHRIQVESLNANIGKSYVGNSTLNVSTKTGIVKTFLVDTATGLKDRLEIHTSSRNSLDLSQLWIDVGTSGEGVSVTYFIE